MARRVPKSEKELLQEKIALLPEGVLKSVLTRFVDPSSELSAAARSRLEDKRRNSIDALHVASASGRGADGVDSVLDLGNCEIGCDGAKQLAELLYSTATRSLTALDLSSNKLTNLGTDFSGIGAICQALMKNTVLVSLSLARNQIQHQGAASIARMLKSNRCIQYLDLSRNMLRSEGCAIIARSIAPHSNKYSQLVSLNLSQNNISNFDESATGGMAIAAALRGHRTLTHLDLSHNRLDSGAMCAVGFAIKNSKKLTDLRLNDNVGDAEAATSIAESLMHNRSLTHIDLSDNRMLSDGAKAIAQAFAANDVIRSIDLRGNHVSEEGRAALGLVLRPDLPAVHEAAERLEDVHMPETRHPRFTTRRRALVARARAAGLLDGEAEEKKAADAAPATVDDGGAAEGKGEEDDASGGAAGAGAAVEEDEEDADTAAAIDAAIAMLEPEDVDLGAKEVTFTSPCTGQTVLV